MSVDWQLDGLPDVLTPTEAAQVLRLGRGSVYEAIRRGDVPSVRIGRRLLVPKAGLLRLLGSKAGAAGERTPGEPPP